MSRHAENKSRVLAEAAGLMGVEDLLDLMDQETIDDTWAAVAADFEED